MADNISDPKELSMEDILSSIKGILSDDNTHDNVTPQPMAPKPEIAAEEDVFDLSASMIVNSQPGVDADVNDFDDEFESLPSVPDMNVEELATGDDNIQDIFNINDTENVEDVIAFENLTGESDSKIDIDSEPIYFSEEDDRLPEGLTAFANSNVDIDSDPIYSEPDDFLVDGMAISTIATKPTIISQPETEIIANPEPIAAPQPISAPIIEPVADVSSDIIDNFAKMFTENKAPVSSAPIINVAGSTLVGNPSLTIEDMLKSVVAESLQPVINQSMAKFDAEILQITENEIRQQTRLWIAENLNKIVEELVRDEVKRVMAKVGS